MLAGRDDHARALIIDCAALDYVSSAGLRIFLLAARTAQRAGISFALCALKPAVREVFDLSGFSRIIAVHADRACGTRAGCRKGRCERATHAACRTMLRELPALKQFLQEFWSAAMLPPRTGAALRTRARGSVHERRHARLAGRYRPRRGVVWPSPGRASRITIEDNGPQFDPLSLPPPDVTASLERASGRRTGLYPRAPVDGRGQLPARRGPQPAEDDEARRNRPPRRPAAGPRAAPVLANRASRRQFAYGNARSLRAAALSD